jgi:hypothetical protein
MATINKDGKTYLEENEKPVARGNTFSMNPIDFERDQQDAMKKTDGVQSLADQVGRLEIVFSEIDEAESRLKLLKKKRDHISGEVIPTMMSEMGLSELKLQDGSHLKVATSYRATITEANKEAAFNWLRNNGLGDIIKNEISGKDMPTEIFGVFSENKTTIKRNK